MAPPPGLLVVAGGVSGQLEHLGGQVLHDGGQVDGRAGPHPLSIVPLPQQPVDAAHGKLQTRPRRARLLLLLGLPCCERALGGMSKTMVRGTVK